MRIIHGVDFDEKKVREYEHVIYQNIVKGMQVLVDAREKLEIPWEHPTTKSAADKIIDFESGSHLDEHNFRMYAATIETLWQDKSIKRAYDRRREFQIVSFLFCDSSKIELFFLFNFRVILLDISWMI